MKKKRVDLGNATDAQRGDYAETIRAITEEGFCPFCEEHLFKHHRRPVIFKTKYWLATENSWPYKGARFHFLFIARPHVERIEDVPAAMWADLQNVYKKYVRKYRLKGTTLMIRSGDTALTGASVTHLHGHIVTGAPRRKTGEPIRAVIGFEK